jgi:hypothetical protein
VAVPAAVDEEGADIESADAHAVTARALVWKMPLAIASLPQVQLAARTRPGFWSR